MANLDNATKAKLEWLFGMASGYVLEFTNPSFSGFVQTAIGVDPYERLTPGSKATHLRAIWREEPLEKVAKLNLDLLEQWSIDKLTADADISPREEVVYNELRTYFSSISQDQDPLRTEFLNEDFGPIDLASLPSCLTARDIVEARLNEIDLCLHAEAPLAVIFLTGSTIEGLLQQVALATAEEFLRADSAPRRKSTLKPLETWSLGELIGVAHELNILGADVSRFAEYVRDFRNYIHPRQQLAAKFQPRMETAHIAKQVLVATLADLKRASRSQVL